MSRKVLQGKKRQQVIENWLAGIDDPEWSVKPTCTEGKYIIKWTGEPPPRGKPKQNESDNEDQEENQEPNDQENHNQEEDEPPKPPKPKKPKSNLPKPYPRQPIQQSSPRDSHLIEILEELRFLGEHKRQKEAKRQQKKLVARQIRKQIPIQPPKEDDEYEYEYEPETPSQPPSAPVYPQRSRVTLLRA
jgi:hypothetical protein